MMRGGLGRDARPVPCDHFRECVALGFDNHREDPIGVLKVTTEAFAPVGAFIRALALPTVVVQEGGYAVSVLGDCLDKFLEGARDFS